MYVSKFKDLRESPLVEGLEVLAIYWMLPNWSVRRFVFFYLFLPMELCYCDWSASKRYSLALDKIGNLKFRSKTECLIF